jgi:hypothetical protein
MRAIGAPETRTSAAIEDEGLYCELMQRGTITEESVEQPARGASPVRGADADRSRSARVARECNGGSYVSCEVGEVTSFSAQRGTGAMLVWRLNVGCALGRV